MRSLRFLIESRIVDPTPVVARDLMAGSRHRFRRPGIALERYPDRPRMEFYLRHFQRDREANRALFDQWLANTKADAIVQIEAAPQSSLYF